MCLKFPFSFASMVLAAVLTAGTASAEIRGGIGVSYVDIGSGTPLSLGTAAVDLSGGWRVDVTNGFNISPEARYITGVGNASSGQLTASLRGSYGGGVRLQFDFRRGVYFFATPSYTRYSLRAATPGGGVGDFNAETSGGSNWNVSMQEVFMHNPKGSNNRRNEAHSFQSPDWVYGAENGLSPLATTQSSSISVRGSDWLWSVQSGVGINFTRHVAAEARYERTEKTGGSALDFFGVALRYTF